MHSPRPRVLADQILQLCTAVERKAALDTIAEPKIRAIVRFYVEDHFAKVFKRPLPDLQKIVDEETAAGSSGGLVERASPSRSSRNNEPESSEKTDAKMDNLGSGAQQPLRTVG